MKDPLTDSGGVEGAPVDEAADYTNYTRYARDLAEGIEAALPRWVRRSVVEVYLHWAGNDPPAELLDRAEAAGEQARAAVGPRVRALLDADVDEQRTTPLALLRAAVSYPTEVLAAAGVPAVERDDYSMSTFPDDRYGLVPASLADVDPGLAEPGLLWGAAKAWVFRRRHQP